MFDGAVTAHTPPKTWFRSSVTSPTTNVSIPVGPCEPPVPVPGSSTVSNTSVTNATAQNVANRATLQTTTFTGSYQGLNNPNRSYLLIQNTGGSTMYVVYGGTQQGTNGLQIPPTGYVETLVGPTNNFSITGDGVLVEGIGP